MTTRAKEISELGNTGFLELDANGNLGIGTNSPEHKLHVKSTAHDEPIALFEADTGTGGDVSIRLEGGGFTAGPVDNPDEIYVEFSDRSDPTNSFAVGMDDDASKLFFGYGTLGTMNGHTQMVLQSNGNVGIGTTSPQEKLEVNGVLQIRRDSDHPALRFAEINSGTTTTRGYIASGDWAVNGGAIDDFGISGSVTGDLLLATNAGTERLRIQNSTGHVGVNDNNPTHTLTVRASATQAEQVAKFVGSSNDTCVVIGENGSQTGEQYIAFQNANTGANAWMAGFDDDEEFSICYSALGEIQAANTKLRVLQNGNVGINVLNPSTRFEVNPPSTNAANSNSRFSEVMGHIHETGGQTEAGRRSIMFFNDVNNFFNGTEKTVWGIAFQNDGNIRGGLQYDHKNVERMTMWSSYGDIEFKVPSTVSGDLRADQTQFTPLTIERETGAIRINRQGAGTAVNITEAQSIYSLQLRNRSAGTYLSFSGDTTNISTIQSMNPNNNGAANMLLQPFGGRLVVGAFSNAGHTHMTVDGGLYIQNATGGAFNSNGNVFPDYGITFPITPGTTTQDSGGAGRGWANIGWQTTARSGEVMHRNTSDRYSVSGTGDSHGFYIEAGTSEAGGICLDEDSVQVYGSSDSGTTFRIIDKDSDVVTAEMLQSSWNWNVRGSVNASASMSSISDQRLKKSFLTVTSDGILDSFANLQLKSYIRVDTYDYMKNNYTDEEELREVGFVAQEVEAVFPECVGTTPIVDPRGMDSVWEEIGEQLTEIKNVNVNQLLYKTMQAVQALIEENNDLKARITALESN